MTTPGNVTYPIGPGPTGRGAVEFWPELLTPIPGLLHPQVTHWVQGEDDDEPARFMLGARVQVVNYGQTATVWNGAWNTDGSEKTGSWADPLPDYESVCVNASSQCSLAVWDVEQARQRATQALRITLQPTVEASVATVLLTQAGTLPTPASDILTAAGQIEQQVAQSGAPAFCHLSPVWLPGLALGNMIVREPGSPVLKSPSGNLTWVFGGGYGTLTSGLGAALVATSQPYGFRTRVETFETVDEFTNTHYVVAEINVLVCWEAGPTTIGVAQVAS